LKRALTDPHILSGIGNAYSDEVLHEARLSPFKRTQEGYSVPTRNGRSREIPGALPRMRHPCSTDHLRKQ
jgi:hypothetical protein